MRTTRTASPAPVAEFAHVEAPDVSIVVVTYGTGKVIVDTLRSFADHVGELSVEVIVVDNPHPSARAHTTTELSLFTSGVLVVHPTVNLGFGGGCEAGALHARGAFLAFVNPDVVVAEGWLERLVDALDDHAAIVAPVLVNPDGTVQEAGQRLTSSGATVPLLEVPDRIADVDYASAACWVMRRELHERTGGFDPRYHPAYFEDVDLALRARAMGFRCVVHPGVQVVHLGGAGTPDTPVPASEQRATLLTTWPSIRWRQSDRPGPNTASTIRRA